LAERLELAEICWYYKRLPVAATRLYGEAFAENPAAGKRYQAACAAALAAGGQGKDARMLPDKVTLMLRRRALLWLRADLDRLATADRQTVRQRLREWREDAGLAAVRDREAVDQLPDGERQQWRQLWDDVAALLKKVEDKK
jgi:hypothetical protein